MATITETREVRNFDSIEIQGRGALILEQGDAEAVVIEADEAVMPHVKAEVEDSRLVLGLEHLWDHLLHPAASMSFRVSAVTLRRVAISGSGSVQAGTLHTEHLSLGISGSGEMDFPQVDAKSVALEISGNGKMSVAGMAEQSVVRISGSGSVQAGKLATKSADVRISGSGTLSVNAADTLDLRISGSGSVVYEGQPLVSQHVSGSGSVMHAA